MSNIWFWGDTHLHHSYVARLRGYTELAEHDAWICDNWNSMIQDNDRVYFLGDFCLANPNKTKEYLSRLRGVKYLIRGNHDRSLETVLKKFPETVKKSKIQWMKDIANINIGETSIALCHYPIMSWNKKFYGAWHIHGHCHGRLSVSHGKMYDVGVDVKSQPIHFDEIKMIMDNKQDFVIDGGEENDKIQND
jgi:calcineurin-like phosphoesterase family protein